MPFSTIAYVHYWPVLTYAASSVHVMKMCQAFKQAGYKTTLYAPDEQGQRPDISQIWHHFGIEDTFNLHLIRPLPFLRKHDVALRAAWAIRPTPHVLAYGRNLAAMMWTSLFGIPTVLEVHDAPSSIQLYYMRLLLRGAGFRRLVVISSPLKEHYQTELALPEEQIIVEPDAVDIERFEASPPIEQAKQQLNINPQTFTVGYAGNLYQGRGIELIIELAERMPEIAFLIVGGKPQHVEQYRQIARDRHLKNLNWVGFVANSQLPLYLAACDILLMPYQRTIRVHNNEGDISNWISPMKMFEYMAARRPIISSDLPVLHDILNEKNALLVTPDALDEWLRGIEHLRHQPQIGIELAQHAYRDVQQFTWKKRVGRLLEQIN